MCSHFTYRWVLYDGTVLKFCVHSPRNMLQIFSSKEDELNMEDISHFLQSCYCLSMGNAALADNGEETAQMVLTAMVYSRIVIYSLLRSYPVHKIFSESIMF